MVLLSQSRLYRTNLYTRGGGTPHIKGVGMVVENFELNPQKETDLGVAQAFFEP